LIDVEYNPSAALAFEMGFFVKNLAEWNAIAHYRPLASRNELFLFKVSSAGKR